MSNLKTAYLSYEETDQGWNCHAQCDDSIHITRSFEAKHEARDHIVMVCDQLNWRPMLFDEVTQELKEAEQCAK